MSRDGLATDTPVPPGTLFNERYEVGEEIGRGGMGIVYLGVDTRLDRKVAIKVLPEAFSTDHEIIARFDREARAMAVLDHPNVVPVYDTGRQGYFNYFVMKFLEGRTVADHLEDVRADRAELYTPEQVRQIIMQACRGLGHAHEKGMVHRDVKPGNIMVGSEGRVTIMDFGIVKAPVGGEALTRTGIVFGTPEYMAPEQAQGEGDPRPESDLYSLGVVAYEMLTGDPPFDGSTPFSLVIKHIKEPPPPLVEKRADLDEAFQEVIFTAMAKAPGDRFPDAEAMRLALEALAAPALHQSGSLPPSMITGDMLRQSPGDEIPIRGTGDHRVVHTSSPPMVRPRSAEPEAEPPPASSGRRRPPPPVSVVRNSPERARDEGPAVLEDRAGYYRRVVTRDPEAESRRQQRHVIIAVSVVMALALIAAGIAMFSGPVEPPDAPPEAPAEP